MTKPKIFLSFFVLSILAFSAPGLKVQAAATGEACSSDSACESNKCLGGICMPGFPITKNLGYPSPDVSFKDATCKGAFYVEVQTDVAAAKAHFDRDYGTMQWSSWKTFCGAQAYILPPKANSSGATGYKAVKDNKYYRGRGWDCDAMMAAAFEYLICEKSNEPPADYCGDGACSAPKETCSTCSSDCGACPCTTCGSGASQRPSRLDFSEQSGVQDGGAVKASDGLVVWTVNLPDNFTKVEMTHYEKNKPDDIQKYLGWQGYLKVNSQIVWQSRGWSSEGGGKVYDAVLDQELLESAGRGLWLEATKFFKAGENKVEFYHNNSGEGIGLKIKVAVGSSPGGVDGTDGSGAGAVAKDLNLNWEISPETVVGQIGTFQKVQIKLNIQDRSDIARTKVKIKIKPENSSIAQVRPGSDNDVWQIGDVRFGHSRTLNFLLELKKIGYTNVTVEVEGDNIKRLYKNLPVWVMALPPSLEFKLSSAGLIMQQGETREITLSLKNWGKGKAYKPEISAANTSDIALIVEKSIPLHLFTILPDKTVQEKIKIKALKPGKLDLKFNLKYALEPASSRDNPDYAFQDAKIINIAVEAEKKQCQDEECKKQVKCLVEVSNLTGCGLEIIDVVPYLDKPVAVILATADACEIATRASKLDPIGASVTGYLATIDIGDNAADAVPVAGNAASAAVDAVEGAADCLEGFVYDIVDENCAGEGEIGGYTGCFKRIAETTAYYTGQAAKAAGSVKSAIYGMFGSPVAFRIVDSQGRELGLADGVLTTDKGEFKTFLIKNPEQLTNGYNVEVLGTADGAYDLHLAMLADGKVLAEKVLTDQTIEKAQSQNIILLVESKNGKITEFSVKGESVALKGVSKGLLGFIIRYSWWLAGGLVLVIAFVISRLKKKKA